MKDIIKLGLLVFFGFAVFLIGLNTPSVFAQIGPSPTDVPGGNQVRCWIKYPAPGHWTTCPVNYTCNPSGYCEYRSGGGGGGGGGGGCPAGQVPVCGTPPVTECRGQSYCMEPNRVLGTGDCAIKKVTCQVNCSCMSITPTPRVSTPTTRPPTPSNTPKPTPTTVPTRPPVMACSAMDEYLNGVIITSNLSQVRYGDTVIFIARTNTASSYISGMSFLHTVTNDAGTVELTETISAPATQVNGVWQAVFNRTMNSYGKHVFDFLGFEKSTTPTAVVSTPQPYQTPVPTGIMMY